MAPEFIEYIPYIIGGAFTVSLAGTLGWVITTRMKIKHGYPLTGGWGQAVYPKTTSEDGERIKLLSQENAQLRAELGSIKDRLGNVERIVTDSGYQLTHQIEALRTGGKGVQ